MSEDLKKMLATLQAEKDEILSRSIPLRAERDALIAEMAPLLAKEKEIIQQYLAIERPRLSELDNQIAALAKAMGGRSLSNPEPVE